jgi:small-conductance mechanosensitive channel
VLKEPAPVALFKGFGDSALNFELRLWTVDVPQVAILRSAVTVAVNNALNAAGIEIPVPQRDLHLRSIDADAAVTLKPGARPLEENR